VQALSFPDLFLPEQEFLFLLPAFPVLQLFYVFGQFRQDGNVLSLHYDNGFDLLQGMNLERDPLIRCIFLKWKSAVRSCFFYKIRAGIDNQFHRIVFTGKCIQRLFKSFLNMAISGR
jgi:hypothetical protein